MRKYLVPTACPCQVLTVVDKVVDFHLLGQGYSWELRTEATVKLTFDYQGSGAVDLTVTQTHGGQRFEQKCTLIAVLLPTCTMFIQANAGAGKDDIRKMWYVAWPNIWCEECGWPSTTSVNVYAEAFETYHVDIPPSYVEVWR